MSTVTIRMEEYSEFAKPRRVPQLLIDGRRIYTGNFVVSFSEFAKPPFELELNGAIVAVMQNQPERYICDDGMAEYTWRDVEVAA